MKNTADEPFASRSPLPGATEKGAAGSWPKTSGHEPLTMDLHLATEAPQWLIGGKAANLAALIRAGLPVPPGFCVTIAAFAAFLDSSPNRSDFFRLPSGCFSVDPSQVQNLSAQALGALEQVPIPPLVQEAVIAAWRTMGEERSYAVRSSATVEDSTGHSFAGQFETVLNVRGRGALLTAIKHCWLSLYSPRALAYCAKQQVSMEKTAMAVVVQEMVATDVGGVLFTVDPVSGDSGRIVIESAPGLGDRLVSGQVSPERTSLEKETLRVVERSPAGAPRHLEEPLARRLGELAREIERALGGPQDVEWAAAGGKVFVLQTRAITATGRTRAWEDRQVWSNLNGGEVIPDVLTPASWSMIRLFLHQIASSIAQVVGVDLDRAPFVGLVAGRIYFNVNAGLAAARPFPRALFRLPRVAESLGGAQLAMWQEGLLRIPDEDLPDVGFRWPAYLLSLPRVIGLLITHSPRRGDAWTAQLKVDGNARRWEDFASMPTSELTRHLSRFLKEGFWGWDLLYLGTQAAALLVFQKVCSDWLDDPELTLGYRLFAGLGGVPEVEAGLALWRLAVLAHGNRDTEAALLGEAAWTEVRGKLEPTEYGRRVLGAWEKFMAEHGHHCRGELELVNPRWFETPDYVLGIVRGYLRSIGQTDPLENWRRLERERERLTEECRRKLRNPVKRWIFLKVLGRAQRLAVNREEWKNQAVIHLTRLRRLLLALGDLLARTGVLDRRDDIFFLEMAEIEPVAAGVAQFDVKAVIRARRAEYDKNLALTPPPVVVGRFNPAAVSSPSSDPKARTFHGIPVFPGVVTGPARVILRTDDHEQVLPGEILVAPFTDPAWTPYFVTAAGVVMDQGGVLSHGSIVAREFGLPAVTNTGTVAQVVQTGDVLEVDGGSGRVRLLKQAEPRPFEP